MSFLLLLSGDGGISNNLAAFVQESKAFHPTCEQLEGCRVELVYRGIDVYGIPALLARACWAPVLGHVGSIFKFVQP